MKRTKQEIIQELIKELSEAPDNIICIKNKAEEDLILGLSKDDNKIYIEITKSLSPNTNPVILHHNDSVVIECDSYTDK